MEIVCHVTVGLFDLVYGIIDSLLEIVMVCSSVSGEREDRCFILSTLIYVILS